MKILLIQPPQTILKYKAKSCQPSLGLGYIASVLRKKHEIVILDSLAEGFDNEVPVSETTCRYGLSFEEIKARTAQIKPDVVGVTCLFSTQFRNALNVCVAVKEAGPGILTMVGGHHISAMPLQVLENRDIDFVVRLEAETIIENFMEAIEKNNDYGGIPNIGYRKNGEIILNDLEINRDYLDALPFPAWDLFPLERYFEINRAHGGTITEPPFFPVLTSRGCPSKCVFCSSHIVHGKKYRKRSVNNIIEELKLLKNNYGAKAVFFEDDNLTLDKERARDLFKRMKSARLDITWCTPNGLFVQSLDEEMLQLMKSAGCHSVSFAVESADPKTQKEIIGKKVDINKVDVLLDKAKDLELAAHLFFIVGFPGESWEQIEATLKYAKSANCENVNIFFATSLPGSELLERCKKNNLREDSSSFDLEDSLNFKHDIVENNRIEKAVHNARLVIKLKTILRNPDLFFEKVAGKLQNDPKYFVKYVKRMILGLVK